MYLNTINAFLFLRSRLTRSDVRWRTDRKWTFDSAFSLDLCSSSSFGNFCKLTTVSSKSVSTDASSLSIIDICSTVRYVSAGRLLCSVPFPFVNLGWLYVALHVEIRQLQSTRGDEFRTDTIEEANRCWRAKWSSATVRDDEQSNRDQWFETFVISLVSFVVVLFVSFLWPIFIRTRVLLDIYQTILFTSCETQPTVFALLVTSIDQRMRPIDKAMIKLFKRRKPFMNWRTALRLIGRKYIFRENRIHYFEEVLRCVGTDGQKTRDYERSSIPIMIIVVLSLSSSPISSIDLPTGKPFFSIFFVYSDERHLSVSHSTLHDACLARIASTNVHDWLCPSRMVKER